ncbi:MAG: DUF6088 family protein [Candidatus Sericytochromatia bacterium]
MTVFQEVREEVEKLVPGSLLTGADFYLPPDQAGALAQSLSRLYKQGVLRRLMKGLYYKPGRGLLGEVSPSYEKILMKLLEIYRKNVSYLTGVNVYSRMGLTTQISREFVIASDRPRGPLKMNGLEIRFLRSYVTETVEDVSMVQILDAIWDIKHIPAANPNHSAKVLLGQLRRLLPEQRQALATYAHYYPPQTRALTGLLFEQLGEAALAAHLKGSLNPLTSYKIGLDEALFTHKRAWNIQ